MDMNLCNPIQQKQRRVRQNSSNSLTAHRSNPTTRTQYTTPPPPAFQGGMNQGRNTQRKGMTMYHSELNKNHSSKLRSDGCALESLFWPRESLPLLSAAAKVMSTRSILNHMILQKHPRQTRESPQEPDEICHFTNPIVDVGWTYFT